MQKVLSVPISNSIPIPTRTKNQGLFREEKISERQTEIAVAMAGDVGIRDKEGGKGGEGRKFHLISI